MNILYVKKPVVVQAMRWIPDDLRLAGELVGWLTAAGAQFDHHGEGVGSKTPINIHTLEGVMRAEPGDWIIRGTEGEFYPCKPAAFDATFEKLTYE